MKDNCIFMLACAASIQVVAVPPPDIAPPRPVEQRAIPANRQIRPIPVPAPNIRGSRSSRPALPSNSTSKLKGENVQLLDGDIFHGKFIGFDPKGGVQWRHPHITPDMQIKPTSVARVIFAEAALPSTAINHSCNVELANGDSLSGELESMEKGKLVLKTWYAGNLSINRSALKSLSPGYTAAKTIFDGPESAKNWSFVNANNAMMARPLPPGAPPAALQQMKKNLAARSGNWKFADNAFECSTSGAMVGRQMKDIPDRSSIEFDVEWASYLNLYVNVFTDNLNSYSSCNAYSLRLNQTYAYLYRYSRTRGSQRIGSNIKINLTSLKNRASIALKVDKKNRILALYINGKFTTKWKDVNEDFAGKSKGLLFSSRSTNPIRVSQIRVREWNGNLPGQTKVSTDVDKEDFVMFNNEDSITGTLIGIKEGQMKFKTSFAELPIPLENVDVIHLSKEGMQFSPIPTGSMRVTLKDRGRLTMKIEEWKDGKITAVSPTFGRTVIDAAALRSVEFNLGKSRTAAAAQPSGLQKIPTRNRAGILELNGVFGNAAPQGIEQLKLQINGNPQAIEQFKLQINGNRLPVRPLPRKK